MHEPFTLLGLSCLFSFFFFFFLVQIFNPRVSKSVQTGTKLDILVFQLTYKLEQKASFENPTVSYSSIKNKKRENLQIRG